MFNCDVPLGWQWANQAGWFIDNTFYFDTKGLDQEGKNLIASFYGFGPRSEVANLPEKSLDPSIHEEVRLRLRLGPEGIRYPHPHNHYYKITLPTESNRHFELAFRRLSKGDCRLRLSAFHHVLTKQLVFIPTISHGCEYPLNITHADRLTFDEAMKIMDETDTPEDFERFQQEFENRFPRRSAHSLTRDSLESLVRNLPSTMDIAMIERLETAIGRLQRIDVDLDPYSFNTVSRVFSNNGQVIFKISTDEISAKRELALLTAAQTDPYLGYFVPRLVDHQLYEYNGSFMFIMEDRQRVMTPMPNFVRQHFSYANYFNPQLHVDLNSHKDFEIYLAALFHWRGRQLKDNLPQVLFSTAYLSFDQILKRFDGGPSIISPNDFHYLMNVYPEAVEILETSPYTTLLHCDMKPENFVINQCKGKNNIPTSIIDFGIASIGPGIYDTVRLLGESAFANNSFTYFNQCSQENAVKYLAFTSAFTESGGVDSDELASTMKLFQCAMVVDGARYSSWHYALDQKHHLPDFAHLSRNFIQMASQYAPLITPSHHYGGKNGHHTRNQTPQKTLSIW